MGLNTKTYWLADRQSQCDFDFDREVSRSWDAVNERQEAVMEMRQLKVQLRVHFRTGGCEENC
jgi:hypothetical protein